MEKLEGCPEGYAANRDSRAERVLERVKGESWRTPAVKVCICPTIDIPMGTGIFRHYICLPDREYGGEELYCVLKHEYTHFCNHDLAVKFLVHLFSFAGSCCIIRGSMRYTSKRGGIHGYSWGAPLGL